jgi:hypothetical protein
MSALVVGFALLQYGGVRVYESPRREGDGALLPPGELHPPLEHWADLLPRCRTVEEIIELLGLAQHELNSWRVRPEPPPDGETLEDLKDRILSYEGWEPRDVSLACRCTPTLVRRARTEGERNPETGREEGSLTHARDLLAQGMSLRQVAVLTGISKSTLHRQARVASGRPGR